LIRDATAIWLTANLEAERLTELGRDSRKVVTPLPVSKPKYSGRREIFRHLHGIEYDAKILLFLGRLDPKKGLLRLIEAFEGVRDKHNSVYLFIVGGGDDMYAQKLRNRAAKSRHVDSIKLVKFLSGQDKADAFASADLFCLHSDNENFGLAIIEALHHGTPAILSDEVYISRQLEALGAAVVVSANDGALLSSTLGRLVSEPSELAALRSRAFRATMQFLPNTVAERDAAVRRSLIERG